MTVELLANPTPSGEYTEHKYDATGPCRWFLFSPVEAEDWVGVFGQGEVGPSLAVPFDNNSAVMVLSGGQGYIVDGKSGQLLHRTSQSHLQGAVAIPGSGAVVAFDFNALHGYTREGLVWRSDPVSHDGILITHVNAQEVRGEATEFGATVPFRVALEGWVPLKV